MPIRFTNTLTGRKEEFRPLNPKQVTMYVCGVTVYDDCHIGHARGAVVFDTLRRFLESRGLKVRHIRNITDVDDKIIERARKEGGADLKTAARAVAERYTARFQQDFARLGLLPPEAEPKATEFIPQMVRFIEALVKNGYAYAASDGVYFSVRTLAGRSDSIYGHLSHQYLDQMLEGVRVQPGEGKKDPPDFALWKKAKPEEPSWPSPWGEGRPGWHIECSTMATDLLGDQFDIHGGGEDLRFPHHENELAQAIGVGKPFARLWLHNGLLTVNGQKMSKSLGNFVTIEEALKRHPADVLRRFFLTTHYKSPVDFTWERLDEAAAGLSKITAFLEQINVNFGITQAEDEIILKEKDSSGFDLLRSASDNFLEALNDDLNTPKAFAGIHLLMPLAERQKKRGSESVSNKAFVRLARDKVYEQCRTLGFFQGEEQLDPAVERLRAERDDARKKKDFVTSDRIREQLTGMGYIVEDTAGGTVVRRKI